MLDNMPTISGTQLKDLLQIGQWIKNCFSGRENRPPGVNEEYTIEELAKYAKWDTMNFSADYVKNDTDPLGPWLFDDENGLRTLSFKALIIQYGRGKKFALYISPYDPYWTYNHPIGTTSYIDFKEVKTRLYKILKESYFRPSDQRQGGKKPKEGDALHIEVLLGTGGVDTQVGYLADIEHFSVAFRPLHRIEIYPREEWNSNSILRRTWGRI